MIFKYAHIFSEYIFQSQRKFLNLNLVAFHWIWHLKLDCTFILSSIFISTSHRNLGLETKLFLLFSAVSLISLFLDFSFTYIYVFEFHRF